MASVHKRKWVYNGEQKEAWAVRYIDETGARRSKQFERKKEADAYRRKVEREIDDGTHVAKRQSSTVGHTCEDYIRHMEDRLRLGAVGRNRFETVSIHVDRSIVPRLGTVLWTDLTPVAVEKWVHAIVREDGLHPRTARDRLQTFKLIEKFAIDRSYIKRAVTGLATSAVRGVQRAKVRTFTAADIQRLLATTERRAAHKHRTNAMMQCFVYIAAMCGLRYGEIVGLTLPNIDFDRRVIRIRHSLPHWDELKGPKTKAGVRDVPMPQHVADAITRWLNGWYEPNDRQLVFRTPKGGRIMGDNFNEMWSGLLTRAGLVDQGETYHFHALRHFAASWWIENGISLMDVAQMMGHEKFDMTLQVYAHPVTDRTSHHAAFERMVARMRDVEPVISGRIVTQKSGPILQNVVQH